MKVRCYRCKREMDFPFLECENCGWIAKGNFRKKSEMFARKYIRIHGNDPELKGKLEMALRGMEDDPESWKISRKVNGEPEVPCPSCDHEMMFPYIQCGNCGWVARKGFRTKARELSEEYIGANPDRETSLRIIWDEENRGSGKKKRKNLKRKPGIDQSDRRKTLFILSGVMIFLLFFGSLMTVFIGQVACAVFLGLGIFLVIFSMSILINMKKKA